MATPREIVALELQLEAAMEMRLDAERRYEETAQRLEETRGKLNTGVDRLERASSRVQGLKAKLGEVSSQIAAIEYRKKLRADARLAAQQAAASQTKTNRPEGPVCSLQYEMARLGADLLKEAQNQAPRK